MRYPIRTVQSLALVAFCLSVFVPQVGAHECPGLIESAWWWYGGGDVIAVSDGYAYVAVSHPWWGSGRFYVLDVNALTYPVEVGFLEIEWVKDVAVSGDYAYTGWSSLRRR